MSPEDFIKLMNRTELDCATLDKIPDGEDFVLVADGLGDEAYAYAEEQSEAGRRATESRYPILGTEGAQTIYGKVSSTDKEYHQIPGNVHCGTNENEKVSSHGADWVVDRLLKA
ncbi:hypothetical protein [Streptomyces sp. NPDC056987]|uniref:hypothetical protein n=1 Tax=Streptomyces sp. NPDC056987 TaxID=3345988 RepID=UPI0036319EA4